VSSWLDSTVPESTCLLMQHSPATPQEMRKDTEGGNRERKNRKKDIRHRQTHMKRRKGNI